MSSAGEKYLALSVEEKWQTNWKDKNLYSTDLTDCKDKYYSLVMFPYPSGDKLHVGHWYNYGPADSWARYMRMKGKNVFSPMGFDSFGLPAENYAIKTGVHPVKSTATNIEYMIKQLSRIGTMYDWEKMVTTSQPDYYKWTQWLFLKLYEKGLAYKKMAPVNWCPSCQTVLANEQVVDGHCERCKTEITRKNLSQWFFKTSDYAEKLLDYEGLDWPEKTITMQKNWIGRSEGAEIDFRLDGSDEILTVYTTRPDTIYSVTFLVIAPEHPLLDELLKDSKHLPEIEKIRKKINSQTLIERTSEGGKDKLGCFTGLYAINPVNGDKVPVYMANFVLMYGTGVVMANAHDKRDFEFARKYDIPLKFVISEDGLETSPENFEGAYTGDGVLFNSGDFDGMNNRKALPKMISWLEAKGYGRKTVNYKLRDWLVSRQRYWGAPIPIIYCKDCGEVPVPEQELPVVLPEDVDFTPSGNGLSPLAKQNSFKNTKCPHCGKAAKREVDTMDTFVCSSWYYLRYPSSKMSYIPFDKALTDDWLPVDMYIGGPEHACMHLLYARFINRFLYDHGFISFKEPFKKLVHQGMITKDGAKMSKSKGNVVSPDEFVEKYGSDVFRMYLMFMGPFTDGGDWNDKGIKGVARFVERFWKMIQEKTKPLQDEKAFQQQVHKLVKKITDSMEKFHFNTAVAGLMEFVNFANKNGIDDESKNIVSRLIAPLAPHLAEECWELLGNKDSVFNSKWPDYDESITKDNEVTVAIQVNGKVRGEIKIAIDAEKDDVLNLARTDEKVMKYLAAGQLVKEIYVPGKIIGFVVK